MFVLPVLGSTHSSAAVIGVDSTVPSDEVIDIVLDEEPTTTTTSTSTTSTTSTTEPTTLEMGIAAPQYLLLESQVVAGQKAATRAVTLTAAKLRPNTTVAFLIQPDGITLGEATVDAGGNASITATIPDALATGSHMLVANGTSDSGEVVSTASAFVLDSSGVVTDVIAPSESMSSPPSLADLQRALDAGAPLYDTAANVATTAAVAVGAAVVGTIAGGGSTGSSSSSSGGSTRSGDGQDQNSDGSQSDSSALGRDTEAQGEVGSLDTDGLQKLEHHETSWGDKIGTWKLPGYSTTQNVIARVYQWSESRSVVLSRILIDGQWLRATFGPVQFLTAYVGLLLGVLGAVSTHGMVILPPIALVFAIMVLSMVDALSGLMAWVGFTSIALIRGEVSGIFDIRTLVGLAIVFIALPLIANHARPLRRPTYGNWVNRVDRVGDYLVAPIVVAFASSAALNAINGLSGLQLVQPHDASTVRWVAAIAVVSRLLIEDIVVRGFPQRLADTHLDTGDGLGVIADYGTVLMKGLLFLLASSSFFGLGWRTWVMVILMTLVPFLKVSQDRYPNFWWIKHWFPQGVIRSTMMIFIGSWFAQWVLSTSSSPNAAKELAPFLMLPGIAVGLIDLFGRQGDKWPNALWTRLVSAGFWVFVIGIMVGRFSV